MSFSVVTNVSTLNSHTSLASSGLGLERTLARLSSGLRINTSADDAAGLAIANRHRLDNVGLAVGIRGSNDAISKLQIEDGAMNNIASLLDRALTLASQATSDTFTGSRATLDLEFQSVLREVTRSATSAGIETGNANLNARSVFVGTTQTNTTAAVTYVSWELTDGVDAQGLGLSTQNVTSQANAAVAISSLQTAVGALGVVQGRVGAAMNRLSFAVSQSQTMSASVQASESRIRDANIAREAAALTKYNILTQSGLAAMSQSNQTSQSVMTLLR